MGSPVVKSLRWASVLFRVSDFKSCRKIDWDCDWKRCPGVVKLTGWSKFESSVLESRRLFDCQSVLEYPLWLVVCTVEKRPRRPAAAAVLLFADLSTVVVVTAAECLALWTSQLSRGQRWNWPLSMTV